MPRGRDSAGNLWEYDALDANGEPINPRPVPQAQPTARQAPGSLSGGYIYRPPPDPDRIAAGRRAEAGESRAAADERRRAADWNATHNPDGSPKVQAPSLLGDPNLTGPDYLASLPKNIRNRVQQLLDGRSILTAREKGTPLGQQLMDAANQADPAFDENASHARYVERTQYTGMGKGSQIVQAANRFARHLGDLYEASRALGGPDLGWAPLSNLATATTNSFHQDKVATYNTILPLIQGEVQKLTKNGAATEGEAEHIMASLSASQPANVRYAALKELARLGRAQIDPLHQSWESAWQGSAPPPIPMDVDPVANAIFEAVDKNGEPPKRDKRGEFTAVLGGTNGPAGGNGGGGGSDGPPPIVPHDFSPLEGGPKATAATGMTRTVYDKPMADALSAFIRKGTPYETAATFLQSHGWTPPDAKAYAEGVRYAAANGGKTNVHADRTLPTTLGERISASPAAAAVTGLAAGGSAGLFDVAGRTVMGPQWDANRQALAAVNPKADFFGNLAGGVGASIVAPELAGKYFPGAMGKVAALAERNPILARGAGNVAYGATYGASENPDDPLGGAAKGGFTALLAGEGGYRATRGLANIIAPVAGKFGPAYENGAFPSIGQRFGGSGIMGRAVNTAEQALQSFPGLGALVARSRELPRQAQKVGMFNDALGHIEPHQPGSILPDAINRSGTEAQGHAAEAFDRAYETARSGMNFAPDAGYLTEVSELGKRINSAEFTPEQTARLNKAVDDAVVSRLKRSGGVLKGDDYVRAGSELGRIRNTWASNPDTAHMADVLGDYMATMDNAAIRSSDPAAGKMLQDTNAGFAKLVRLQKAGGRAGGEAGDFTPKAFTSVVQKEGGGVRNNAFNQGRALMQDDAEALSLMGDTLPNSGSADRLLTGQAAAGGVGYATGAGGALMAHPGALAPFALYAPGIDAIVKRAIAPREYVLPPTLAQPLNLLGSKVNQAAPMIGRAVVPGSLAYFGVGQ